MARDITNTINNMNKDPHDAKEDSKWYEDFDFVDDVTGGKLNHKFAVQARKLEMEFFRRTKVYDKVPRWMAKQTGGKIITTRWLDINKDDQERPDYRSRLVGRELAIDKRLDLFAATPPLESLKMICAICGSNQKRRGPFKIMTVGVRRAYFYAKAQRSVFIEIPEEDREPRDEKMVGKLSLSLYGTRDAAQNWAAEYTTFLQPVGFRKGLASPCNFYLEQRRLTLTVCGDDFTVAGPIGALQRLGEKMQDKREVKQNILGPEKEFKSEAKVLNRMLRWTKDGIQYEPDQRHSDLIAKALGLENARPLTSPGAAESRESQQAREESRE